MSDNKRQPTMAQDGWTPAKDLRKGWTPKGGPTPPALQGGNIPTIDQVGAPPPTGGSGVKPLLKK